MFFAYFWPYLRDVTQKIFEKMSFHNVIFQKVYTKQLKGRDSTMQCAFSQMNLVLCQLRLFKCGNKVALVPIVQPAIHARFHHKVLTPGKTVLYLENLSNLLLTLFQLLLTLTQTVGRKLTKILGIFGNPNEVI